MLSGNMTEKMISIWKINAQQNYTMIDWVVLVEKAAILNLDSLASGRVNRRTP